MNTHCPTLIALLYQLGLTLASHLLFCNKMNTQHPPLTLISFFHLVCQRQNPSDCYVMYSGIGFLAAEYRQSCSLLWISVCFLWSDVLPAVAACVTNISVPVKRRWRTTLGHFVCCSPPAKTEWEQAWKQIEDIQVFLRMEWDDNLFKTKHKIIQSVTASTVHKIYCYHAMLPYKRGGL